MSPFVTLFLLHLDPVSRVLRYSNAGDHPGFVLGASGDLKAELRSTSAPLAVAPNIEYTVSPAGVLEPGDVVVLTTDGIPDARASDASLFGTDRMLEVVRSSLSSQAREIVENLQRAVLDFTGRRQPEDDIACVIVRVQP